MADYFYCLTYILEEYYSYRWWHEDGRAAQLVVDIESEENQ